VGTPNLAYCEVGLQKNKKFFVIFYKISYNFKNEEERVNDAISKNETIDSSQKNNKIFHF